MWVGCEVLAKPNSWCWEEEEPGGKRRKRGDKIQSVSSQRCSPRKGHKCTKNYTRRLNKMRAINARPSPVSLCRTLEERDAEAESCNRCKSIPYRQRVRATQLRNADGRGSISLSIWFPAFLTSQRKGISATPGRECGVRPYRGSSGVRWLGFISRAHHVRGETLGKCGACRGSLSSWKWYLVPSVVGRSRWDKACQTASLVPRCSE